MSNFGHRWLLALGGALTAAALVGGCGGSKGTASTSGHESTSTGFPSTGSGTSTGNGGAPSSGAGSANGGQISINVGAGGMSTTLEVTPSAMQTITVPMGSTTPTVAFTATVNGSAVNAAWAVDKGNVGTIAAGPSSMASFTPSGTTGGVVTVTAGYQKQTVTRPILVQLTGSQNGSNPSNAGEAAQIPGGVGDLSAGGGVGGVGGEGLGGAVMDQPTLMALGNPMNTAAAGNLSLLYPYNATVWPRGMLAPLLMWSWSMGDADAIKIDLKTTTGSFSWSGTFARPAILMTTMGKFIRHPIPQDVWDAATNTASGKSDQLTVSLTVALNGQAYGPVQQTWTVAPARLTGTVYYNSYGTQLVKNWGPTDAVGNRIGAAILGVHSGDTGPTLIAGTNSTDDSGCRVCHVVAQKGRWLLTQSEQGNPGDGQSYLYDLSQANVPASAVTLATQGTFGWAALTGDGSYAFTNMVNPSSSNPAIGAAQSTFWNFIPTQPPPMMSPTTMPAMGTLTGLPGGLKAGYPSYAPDDKMVAYVDATANTGDISGPIVIANFDTSTQTFSNPQTIQMPASGQRVGYPVFLPDDSGVIFETEVRSSCSDTVMVTRNGARSELWWATAGATPMPVPLAALNGVGYLPAGPNNHGGGTSGDPQNCGLDESKFDDTTLDYEPTVLPIVEGGYAWVVFTSRRLYGNQLTATPWQSWPPDYDTLDLSQGTVKKLWVAAIDLSAPAGSDPSHPAFYLPAQEILAGNSRGFWVLDPCKADGSTCESGDQCCNGYCEPNGPMQSLICSNMAPNNMCSGPQEKCTTSADCCDPTNRCVNGFCAQSTPQ